MTWEGLDSSQRGGKLGRQILERVPSEDRQLQSQPSQQIGRHSILVTPRLPSLGRGLGEDRGRSQESRAPWVEEMLPGDGRLAGWKNR